MNVRSDLAMAYLIGYEDALAKRMPDATKAGVLNSSNCTNSERTSDELKPCPFCGGPAYLERGFNYDYDGGDRWYVYSADVVCSCGCTLHVDNAWPKEYVSEEHSLDFAIAAWNRRADA